MGVADVARPLPVHRVSLHACCWGVRFGALWLSLPVASASGELFALARLFTPLSQLSALCSNGFVFVLRCQWFGTQPIQPVLGAVCLFVPVLSISVRVASAVCSVVCGVCGAEVQFVQYSALAQISASTIRGIRQVRNSHVWCVTTSHSASIARSFLCAAVHKGKGVRQLLL